MADAGIGLSPAEVDRVFPFHFVLDGKRRLRQRGPGLRRLDPAFIEGTDFDQVFELLWPKGKIRGALSVTDSRLPVIIRHRPSGIRMRGDFLGVGPQRWMFIGSPWFESAEALEASGLALTDFPPNDPIVDLLMMERTRQVTLEDLRNLAGRLETQRGELARTEDLYRSAISAANAVPYRENFATQSFDFIGAGIFEMTGVPAQEMTPALLDSMVLERTEESASDDTTSTQGVKANARRRDLCIRTRGGGQRWMNDASVLVLDESGLATGRVGILFDITRRKDRENRLRASEEKSSQLAEVVSRTKSVVIITDADRHIVWGNAAFESLCGCPVDEVRGKLLREIFDMEGGTPGARDVLAELDAGRSWAGELKVRNRSGSEWTLSVETQPILDEHGVRVRWMVVASDVTDLRRTQDLLREREEEARRLAMVAARTDNAVILTDAARRIEWVNEGFTRLTGYTLDEARGRVPGSFLQGPETDPGTIRMIRERLDAGQGFQCEIQNQRKDGKAYWVSIEVQPIFDPSGNHTGYMAIESDATARRQYEERLRLLSAELETILRLSPDGYVMFDSRGRLSYCNASFERMARVARAEVRGLEYVQVDRLLAAACDPSNAPASILSLRPGVNDRLVLKGSPKVVLLRAVIPITDGHGGVQGRILFLHDVTRADELQQMKSDFLATAAHELRTPMTSVQGFSELLMEESLDPETVRDVAGTIHRQSSTLVSMVNDLLDLQRIEQRRGREFERTEQSLQPLIRRVVSELRVAGDDRQVGLEGLPQQPVRVSVDATQFGQALTNVLTNAYKYSPGGGAIVITLEDRVRDGVRQVGVQVRDQGIGMTPAQRLRVFERFYRADPSGAIPGTGLGMALVKEIMDLHGGSVEVESEQGVGTTVTLWLPV